MVSHVSLLVVIITAKNSSSCSQGLAKYKIYEELSQTIKFKYFFSTNQSPHVLANGNLVFISGKYIVENSEPCFTIAYSSIIGKNPNYGFDMTAIPICIPHCIYSVIVNREPKEVKEFIHFGAETVEYNSVTGKPDVKIDLTIIYPSQSSRFKYLGPSGSNIKSLSTYFISGFLKFSKSGKMMIEATNVDYLKTSTISITASKTSSLTIANTLSIIDLIDDDIDLTTTRLKQQLEPFLTSAKNIDAYDSGTQVIGQLSDDDVYDQKTVELEEDMNSQDEIEELDEEVQPKKRRKSAKGIKRKREESKHKSW
ncbi:21369_t:CDS:1 [Racocetra persica]|uniref:21369_t:CDS:1 n=1 Tax=Racocetra persica TaxID=160502 RepID=A0ACA9MWF0_9GLOM|nr:21369_t:CDS:1 [Racocetra persica]